MKVEPITPRLAYSIVEAAKALGVSRSTFYRLMAEGQIDARSLGGRVLIPVAVLEAFIAGLPRHESAP